MGASSRFAPGVSITQSARNGTTPVISTPLVSPSYSTCYTSPVVYEYAYDGGDDVSAEIAGTFTSYAAFNYVPASDWIYFSGAVSVAGAGGAVFNEPTGVSIASASYGSAEGLGYISQTDDYSTGYVEWIMVGVAAWPVTVSSSAWNPSSDAQPSTFIEAVAGDSSPYGYTNLGACVLEVTITASDSQDSSLRYWAVYVDQSPPSGEWWTKSPSPAYMTTEYSGSEISFTIGEAATSHTVYFIVSQDGGSSYGTYSGSGYLNSSPISFSGVDWTDYASWTGSWV
jgi:hypothetical protein